MSKIIKVAVVPQVNYGALSFVYKPTCAMGEKLLAACKKQFSYKPAVAGKERNTFAPEWQSFVHNLGFSFEVEQTLTVSVPKVGTIIGQGADADAFLAML